jgi:hypothetical protein
MQTIFSLLAMYSILTYGKVINRVVSELNPEAAAN